MLYSDYKVLLSFFEQYINTLDKYGLLQLQYKFAT